MKRNLLFHLYPVEGSLWEWHVGQLVKHRRVFNGRRIVTIALDEKTVPLAEAERRLKRLEAELITAANDPSRGETRHFLRGLGRLKSLDEHEMTFYAHAKGVTHRGLKSLVMQSWSQAMYAMNLSAVGVIESLMRRHCAAGCFRQEVLHGGSWWHYSGNFFWVKHSALFARDWRRIGGGKYGVEGYLGRHLPVEESAALTPFRHFTDLYKFAVPREEYRGWLRALRPLRLARPGGAPASR
ncbi:MAG: hypothetical protein HY077_15695 [Elusimicrobia bacterium]|nr:hypothetical protein [Elusimicrobiota bacterium]